MLNKLTGRYPMPNKLTGCYPMLNKLTGRYPMLNKALLTGCCSGRCWALPSGWATRTPLTRPCSSSAIGRGEQQAGPDGDDEGRRPVLNWADCSFAERSSGAV